MNGAPSQFLCLSQYLWVYRVLQWGYFVGVSRRDFLNRARLTPPRKYYSGLLASEAFFLRRHAL